MHFLVTAYHVSAIMKLLGLLSGGDIVEKSPGAWVTYYYTTHDLCALSSMSDLSGNPSIYNQLWARVLIRSILRIFCSAFGKLKLYRTLKLKRGSFEGDLKQSTVFFVYLNLQKLQIILIFDIEHISKNSFVYNQLFASELIRSKLINSAKKKGTTAGHSSFPFGSFFLLNNQITICWDFQQQQQKQTDLSTGCEKQKFKITAIVLEQLQHCFNTNKKNLTALSLLHR